MKDFKLYFYRGPVMINDNCVKNSWKAETMALDKRDAYNKFVMKCRYLAVGFLEGNAKITLPGQLSEDKS